MKYLKGDKDKRLATKNGAHFWGNSYSIFVKTLERLNSGKDKKKRRSE
jgi:hypothetical protein